ncbi:hypothetical protein HDV63DRAFT_328557 [Trichoderma sp. SZMC 28014]
MGAPAADAKLQRQEAHTNGCLAAVAATANGDAYCTPTELTHREASKSVDASLPLKPARIRKRRAEPGRARAGSEGETARKEERRVGRREGRDGERKTTSPACQGKKRSTESVYGGSVKAKTDTVSRFLHCASTPYRSADDWGRCSQALEYRPVDSRRSTVQYSMAMPLFVSHQQSGRISRYRKWQGAQQTNQPRSRSNPSEEYCAPRRRTAAMSALRAPE